MGTVERKSYGVEMMDVTSLAIDLLSYHQKLNQVGVKWELGILEMQQLTAGLVP